MTRAGWLLVVIAACLPAPSRAQAPVPVPVDTTRAITDARTAFNVIHRESYLRRHAFSFDHFLEFEPGGVLARLGPIGNDAFWSRWGIGSGRARMVLNGIPINDPQDGRAPLAHIATSGLGALTLDAGVHRVYAPGMEGSIALDDLEPRASRPTTFIELSKGTNEVRQRRVRFGSQQGRVGVDLSYDEVLDDGYDFDAGELVTDGVSEGRALSRNASVAIRGDLGDDTDYSLGVRRFRASSTGDLESALSESTKSGHLLWATVGAAATATVYGRGYNSDRPDSSATNETVGGVMAWDGRRGDASLHVFALGEHTNATQDIGGAHTDARATTGLAGMSTEASAGAFTWFAHGNVAGDRKSWAWGAGGGIRVGVPRGDVTLSAQRTFRLPSLGERYAPEHARDDLRLSGNRGVGPESALEAGADWSLRAGAFTNRARAAWMRSEDFIAFRPVDGGQPLLRLALNADDEPTMSFFEERIGVAAMLAGFEVRGDAGGYFTEGDRTGAFASVPRMQLNGALELGRQLFEKSSALYLGGEYAFVGERYDYRGNWLPEYHVVNLSLVGRLVDARFYLRWLNLLDESYQTVSGYRMTPRTLAYGIEWTLFD